MAYYEESRGAEMRSSIMMAGIREISPLEMCATPSELRLPKVGRRLA
jgi:hypothetical protein